jgi:hypothetical protein
MKGTIWGPRGGGDRCIRRYRREREGREKGKEEGEGGEERRGDEIENIF